MKRPSEAKRLEHHREQALSYWRNASDSAHNVPAPRFVVLCAFRRFEVWEPGAYPTGPRAEFDLIELPDRLDALLFLADREPVFVESQEAVTRQAVSLMTGLYDQLGDRLAASPDVRRNFLLQTVWCLFAEDLGQLEGHLRSTLCREHAIGLTTLYNRADDGAYSALRSAHRDLDLAVLAAYGWSSALLDDVRQRNRALLDLNTAILAGDMPYSPF